MLRAGLASVTFRRLDPRDVVAAVRSCGLHAIEWAGDAHAPAGDVRRARALAEMTREAGLAVAGYDSYFRLGRKMAVEPWLDVAAALGAPTMRLWAGGRGSADTAADERRRSVEELRAACGRAAACGLTLSLEFHEDTLADSAAAVLALMEEVGHAALRTYWQAPRADLTLPQMKSSLASLQGRLTNMHVFSRDPATNAWLPLARAPWRELLATVATDPVPHAAMIEFVRGDRVDAFREDAAVLRSLIAELGAGDWAVRVATPVSRPSSERTRIGPPPKNRNHSPISNKRWRDREG